MGQIARFGSRPGKQNATTKNRPVVRSATSLTVDCRALSRLDGNLAGTLYIDGHVRVYHGQQTRLPKHYVARQKLCLRATTDYWINAMDGQPFFLVNQAIDPGLIKVIEQDIVPQLEQYVPNQPGEQRREQQPLLHRFVLVFDREGYSPDFLWRMKRLRIAWLRTWPLRAPCLPDGLKRTTSSNCVRTTTWMVL